MRSKRIKEKKTEAKVLLAPLTLADALSELLATKPPKPAKKETKAKTPETKKPAKKAGKKSSK